MRPASSASRDSSTQPPKGTTDTVGERQTEGAPGTSIVLGETPSPSPLGAVAHSREGERGTFVITAHTLHQAGRKPSLRKPVTRRHVPSGNTFPLLDKSISVPFKYEKGCFLGKAV